MELPPELGEHGWRLLSAEAHHANAPDTFSIPSREKRESLRPGQGAQLLFQLADKADDDRLYPFVERMWVLIRAVTDLGYDGILANKPASSHAQVERGSAIPFTAEHVINIDDGPAPEELDKLVRFANRNANPS